MANNYLRAHGVTIKFGAAAAIDEATVIGIPGEEYDLIEKPSLTDTRKDYDLSDTPDSPEIVVTVPYAATVPAVGDTSIAIIITLPKAGKTVSFNGKVISVLPGNAEVGGLLGKDVTIKPTSKAVIAAT
jgi:hypothetical protein